MARMHRWETLNSTQYRTGEHLNHLFGAPCFDPAKDIVLAGYKPAFVYAHSPLLGQPARPREILLFLRGDVGKGRLQSYSNGVRQALYKHAREEDWKVKFNILIGDRNDIQGDYSELLASSKYCVVAPGAFPLCTAGTPQTVRLRLEQQSTSQARMSVSLEVCALQGMGMP